jgi:hypothetical protein
MSLLIDLEDANALEKLGLALCKIPSVLTELSKNVMEMPESRAVIIEHIKDSVANPEFRATLKTFVIDMVKEDIDFKESLKSAFDYSIAISDHKILKRLFEHDILLGLEEPFDTEEERAPNLQKQIKELSDRIEQPLNNSPEIDLSTIPLTTLDLKACELVEHLKDGVKPRNNEVFMNSREIINYLKTELPPELRLKDISNPRQAKKDILNRAVKLFPNTVCIVRNKSGNKVTGLALTQSAKRNCTDSC